MQRSLRPIFSFILVLLALTARSQQDSTVAITIDTGLEIYVDYGKLITQFSDFESKLEIGIAFQLANHLAPNFQAGYGSLEPATAFENGIYESTGYYGRIGVNYLIPFDNTNSFFIGTKYGLAFFEDEGTYEISSDIFDTYRVDFGEENQEANWVEIIVGSEKKLNNEQWSVGGQFALRILNQRDEFTPVDTYAIPGYGRTIDKTVPALNVYLKYKF